jgi:hypothetical protein
LISETPEADRGAALRYVYEWACGHEQQFYGRFKSRTTGSDGPSGGWAGRWDESQLVGARPLSGRSSGSVQRQLFDGPKPLSQEPATLGFLPDLLKRILRDAGFDSEAIIRIWRDRGWLVLDRQGTPRWKTRLAGNQIALTGIKGEAITAVAEVAEDESSERTA